MAETLGGIASFLGAELKGDPARVVDGAAPLDTAKPSEISFLANPRYAVLAGGTSAVGVICRAEDAAKLPAACAALISANPYRDFARCVARRFEGRPRAEAGIHATAVVHATAVLASRDSLGAGAV